MLVEGTAGNRAITISNTDSIIASSVPNAVAFPIPIYNPRKTPFRVAIKNVNP